NVTYSQEKVDRDNIDESTIYIYWHNKSSGQWIPLRGVNDPDFVLEVGRDTENNYVWAKVTHFSVYAIGGSVYGRGGTIVGGGGGAIAEDKSVTAVLQTPTQPWVDVQFEAIFSSIAQGKKGIILIPVTGNMSLTEMAVKVKTRVVNVKIIIKSLASIPTGVIQNISGEVLRYFEVEHTNIVDADVETVTIKFKVGKQWLTNNEIDPANVVLFRYSGGEWNALPAQMSSEDSNNVYYSAESPGLSLFAITGLSEALILEPVVVETPQPTETLAPTPAPTEVPEPTRRPTPSPYIPPEEPVPTTPSPTPAPTPVPPPKPVYMRGWFVVTELIVLLAVVIFVLYKKGKRNIKEEVERLKKKTNRLREQFRRP
ncbi:MAG: PGF-pre-PGF domain-containing protein, partial [Candidatus Hydrothermarchaeales archaeon]